VAFIYAGDDLLSYTVSRAVQLAQRSLTCAVCAASKSRGATPRSEESHLSTSDPGIIARGVFAEIAKRFPSLKMVENHGEPVEISVTMPVQPGLAHEVWLCLQNGDELGFSTGHFYCEWFPCTKSDRAQNYLDVVTGFLSGKYRILEHYRGAKCYNAQLQKPEGEHWRTIANWATIWIPFWLRRTVKEVRNS